MALTATGSAEDGGVSSRVPFLQNLYLFEPSRALDIARKYGVSEKDVRESP